jgi:hypothetical protein
VFDVLAVPYRAPPLRVLIPVLVIVFTYPRLRSSRRGVREGGRVVPTGEDAPRLARCLMNARPGFTLASASGREGGADFIRRPPTFFAGRPIEG